MKEEEKQLLIKDLCARLPYGLKCEIRKPLIGARRDESKTMLLPIDGINKQHVFFIDDPRYPKSAVGYKINEIKPILFPLSCLTQEITIAGETFVPMDVLTDIHSGMPKFYGNFEHDNDYGYVYDWPLIIIEKLHKWHIDYRGLIDRGLAVSVYSLDKNPYE